MPHCITHSKKKQLTFFITSKCNLRCRYCYTDSATEQSKLQTIDINFAKCGLRDFFSSQDSRMIRFYGVGEPTVEFELIKELRDYAYELAGEDLHVEIQTNGTFPRKVAEWIADHVHLVWISLDGPPEFNDKLRPNAAGKGQTMKVLKNIDYLKDRTFVGVRPTITPETLPVLPQLVGYFHSMGVKALAPNPEISQVGHGSKLNPDSTTTIDMMAFAQQLEKAWHKADRLGMALSSELIFNFGAESRYNCRACLPAPHLTIDGYVSCCDIGLWGDTIHQDLIYGQYHKESDTIEYSEDRIANLRRRSADNIPHCQDCIAKYNCAGGCLGRTAHQSGSIWGQRKDYCQAVQYLADRMPRNIKSGAVFHP